MIALNLTGAFVCAQRAARIMVDSGTQGRIVNVTSVHEHAPLREAAAYCAAKGGLGLLTKVMALELGEYGINVNSVAPGEIATGMTGAEDEPPEDHPRPGLPLGRPGHAREVAATIAFLASPGARYITGGSFVVDGGLLLTAAEFNRVTARQAGRLRPRLDPARRHRPGHRADPRSGRASRRRCTATTPPWSPSSWRPSRSSFPARVPRIGSGESLNESPCGMDWPPVAEQVERMEEALEIIDACSTASALDHDGRFFRTKAAYLHTRGERRPPVYVSAFGPQRRRRGRASTATACGPSPTPSRRPGSSTPTGRPARKPGASPARSSSRPGSPGRRTTTPRWRAPASGRRPCPRSTSRDDWHDPKAMYEKAEREYSDEDFLEQYIVGSDPDQHVERIRAVECLGATVVCLQNASGADPVRALEMYGERVLPALRACKRLSARRKPPARTAAARLNTGPDGTYCLQQAVPARHWLVARGFTWSLRGDDTRPLTVAWRTSRRRNDGGTDDGDSNGGTPGCAQVPFPLARRGRAASARATPNGNCWCATTATATWPRATSW